MLTYNAAELVRQLIALGLLGRGVGYSEKKLVHKNKTIQNLVHTNYSKFTKKIVHRNKIIPKFTQKK